MNPKVCISFKLSIISTMTIQIFYWVLNFFLSFYCTFNSSMEKYKNIKIKTINFNNLTY